MDSKKFDLSVVLTVVSGVYICDEHPDGFGAVYDILNYMTGDDLYKHALPRAREEMTPIILDEYPSLREYSEELYELSKLVPQGYVREYVISETKKVLKRAENEIGKTLIIYPCHPEDHEYIDSIEEAVQMLGDENKLIVLDMTDDEEPSEYGDINWKVEDGE